jgi:ketosteroid isomerase-like protein
MPLPHAARPFVAACLLLLLALVPAPAQPLGPDDRAAIRAVIEQQLAAFQADDGAAAFDLAAPAIRRQFATADNFMRMVQQGYQPVYRPREVAFGELTATEEGIIQRVELVGPDGQPVTALYVMEKQPDGRWLINGCILTASKEKAA